MRKRISTAVIQLVRQTYLHFVHMYLSIFICLLCQTRTHVNKLRATCVLKYEYMWHAAQSDCNEVGRARIWSARCCHTIASVEWTPSFDGGRFVLQRHVVLSAHSWCCFLAHMYAFPAACCLLHAACRLRR